jgi:two-component system response regulator TctD
MVWLMKLLLIEDDLALYTSLQRALARLGWAVEVCADGRKALAHWRTCQPDVVLLDLTLPGRDGLQILQQARDESLVAPVLIMTARGTVGDRVQGLNAGADDYLPKPFDLDELEARVRALHRRHSEDSVENYAIARQSSIISYDKDSGAIYYQGQVMALSPRELALLKALLARPGHAVAKEKLFALVFPGELNVQSEAIEVVVYRLRKKLQTTGTQLVTLRGLGYLLKAPA